MPFGLCNAPAVFQRNMQHVLAGLLGTKCLCYIDDILVIGKTRQEHDNNLREVLTRLQQHGFKSKPSKCSFGMNSIKLLGHIIDRNGIHTDPAKGEAISKMAPPTNVKGVRRFLGMCGYYRDLIPAYAQKAAPLVALTKYRNKFVWGAQHQRALDTLKKELLSEHCVAYPDSSQAI